jgi:hypothetical protein
MMPSSLIISLNLQNQPSNDMADDAKPLWPVLIFEAYKDTLTTVHLWTQIIGKIRLIMMPWLNHSWHVTLYVSGRGLTTGSIPCGKGVFQIDMDFIDHKVVISCSDGTQKTIKLFPRSVASFYQELFSELSSMNIEVTIYPSPNEIDPAIPFQLDTVDRSYDPVQMHRIWQALVQIGIVFTRFRSEFIGKASPVHLFWGSFDLAVTRFSGREAPKYTGAVINIPKAVMEEAYSHEVSSCGFWPGNDKSPVPVFYSYCYPTPPEFSKQPVSPAKAFYSDTMGEFLLPYEIVQQAEDPTEILLQFLRSTYKAAALTGHWNRNLECDLRYLEK